MTSRLQLPKVIGHRGTPRRAPENTVAGFALASEAGVAWVELDVQLSADLVPVVFHDDRLERTSTGTGFITERDYAYLRDLDVGGWFSPEFAGEKLPHWDRVLDLLIERRLGVNIEIKASDARGAVTAEIGLKHALAKWPDDLAPPLVTSFSRSAIDVAHKVAPQWPRGLVSDPWPEDWREVCARDGCATLHILHTSLTPERVAMAKDAGLAVLAYTVNEPEAAAKLWEWGVDSVFSDRPELLLG
ncbi:MAG TPA: glycerophosphoryl diester phosphodiesterase [Magnetospirillaceae bacterium]|nr:glycerophosphoryl diester phosphodiesterase [Magnetospirillaceae bacterium]